MMEIITVKKQQLHDSNYLGSKNKYCLRLEKIQKCDKVRDMSR